MASKRAILEHLTSPELQVIADAAELEVRDRRVREAVIEELMELARELAAARRRGEALGLTEDETAFYDALGANDSAVAVLGDQVLAKIARELTQIIRDSVTIDWTVKETVRARLRTLVRRKLRQHGYPPDKAERAVGDRAPPGRALGGGLGGLTPAENLTRARPGRRWGPMSAAEAVSAVVGEISEPLTWAEICARYPDEWVCLVEVSFVDPTGPEVSTARVVGHGKTRGEPFAQASSWWTLYDEIGHFYTGHITAPPRRPSLILDDEIRDLIRPRR